MASHLLIVFLLTVILHSSASQFNNGFLLLKVTKDLQTHQYTTQLLIGTPQIPTKLVLHLSGQSLWLNCPPSPSQNIIPQRSLQCLMAKSGCDIQQQNPITGEANTGDLTEDIVTVNGLGLTVDRFLFSCSPDYLLNGLVAGAKGVLGLGRSKISFQSQMVNNFDFPRTFTVCLSSSDGFITSGTVISRSLSYTPLISTKVNGHGYFLHVNSIKVNGRRLTGGDVIGSVEISSVIPYTKIKTTIYEVFTKAYIRAATAMNMTMVAPVAPFGVCFSISQVTSPDIDLVLQSELVKWRIQGMVKVTDSVMCLGFVDGGLGMNGSMVLGGYQLEDYILEFNLGTGMMGFSSLLVKEGNSCSNIRESLLTPKDSL